jgi:2-keto-4-pentenoate hydratase/2-oxohepta-3-ene-1,7-dioic acid hydratase in catechol pathway
MRLATIQTTSGPRAAAFVDGSYVDLHATDANIPASMLALLTAGADALKAAAAASRSPKALKIPAAGIKLLSPVPDPQKVLCIGLNYRDHAEETGAAIPREPILFSKFATALSGEGDDIVLPPVSTKVDYEAELVLVVGRKGRYIPEADALDYLVGYTIGNDVSARDWQLEKDGKQWMAGKTFDTFAPTGPHLVTRDEIPDPHNLAIRLRVNGETLQDSNTRQLIFRAGAILSYVSQVMTLLPGDLIFTGTPPGVGMARKPPIYLKAGDTCEVEIEGLGVLTNPVVAGYAL